MDNQKNKPSEQLIKQAKSSPNGWVYQIEGKYSPSQAIPPQAIVGAWRVDSNGNIVGDFIPNPNYKPRQEDK